MSKKIFFQIKLLKNNLFGVFSAFALAKTLRWMRQSLLGLTQADAWDDVMEGAAGVVILMQFGEANSIKSCYFSSSFAAGNRLSEQSAAASESTRSQLWILAGFASLIIGAPILAWTLGDGEKSQAQKTYVYSTY